jgi:hypothetical protein
VFTELLLLTMFRPGTNLCRIYRTFGSADNSWRCFEGWTVSCFGRATYLSGINAS